MLETSTTAEEGRHSCRNGLHCCHKQCYPGRSQRDDQRDASYMGPLRALSVVALTIPGRHARCMRSLRGPTLEEVVASFAAATSACTGATSTMTSHPAQLTPDSVPLPLEYGQSQVTPPPAA
jgi:hypothetical protein